MNTINIIATLYIYTNATKTFIALFLLLFVIAGSYAQQADTLMQNDIYTSYYSYQLHEPLYVVYKLYQGGGDCSRKAFHFKTDGLPNSAKPKDYKLPE